jgi:hypothetical protein
MLKRKRDGMFQGCFAPSKWGNQRKLQKWDKFVQFAPKLAKMRMEVPNKLRPLFGISKMKHAGSRYPGQDSSHVVPDALCEALKTLLAERIVAGEKVLVDFASLALGSLIRKWNFHVDNLRIAVQEKIGGEILQEEDRELADASAAMANAAEDRAVIELERRLQEMGLRKISVALNAKNLQRTASKCCQKVGVYNSLCKESKHLATDPPAVEEVRAYVTCCVREKKIHERLIANFDQVWCLQYETPRAVLGISDGRKRNPNNGGADKELISIREALRLPGESEPSSKKNREPAEAPCVNPQGKLARTTTTLSWSDGTMGRAFVTAAAGSVCSPQIFLCTHLHCD